jgi:hypothetical protein
MRNTVDRRTVGVLGQDLGLQGVALALLRRRRVPVL